MTLKEKLKKEIDTLPANLVEEILQFVHSIKTGKKEKRKLHSFKLKGQFDNVNIRKMAYE